MNINTVILEKNDPELFKKIKKLSRSFNLSQKIRELLTEYFKSLEVLEDQKEKKTEK